MLISSVIWAYESRFLRRGYHSKLLYLFRQTRKIVVEACEVDMLIKRCQQTDEKSPEPQLSSAARKASQRLLLSLNPFPTNLYICVFSACLL